MKGSNEVRSKVALVFGVIAISFAAIFFRKAAPTHPLIASATRLGIASVLLLPFFVRARPSREVTRTALIAGFFYALHFGAWVWSLTLTSVASSVTLVTATPIMLAAWALLTRTDQATRRHWFAIVIALVGLALIGWRDLGTAQQALTGDALALLGAFAMAVNLVLVRRLGDIDVFAFGCVACGSAAVVIALVALAMGVPFTLPDHGLFYMFLCALIPQIIGHGALTWSLRHLKPTVVGMATVGEPVGSTILAWWVLDENLDPLIGLGCAITLAAVIASVKAPQESLADKIA